MPIILNIETSSTNCSVSLSNNNKLIDCLEKDSPNYSHSQKLHSFISELMEKNNISFKDLDAVAVGIGPGSYTGLRIGLSAAKGICYALDIPLISVSSLENMVSNIQFEGVIISTIDARRDEVYSCIFDKDKKVLREEIPEIIECHYTTGNWSVFIKVLCNDNEHLMELIKNKIQTINGISRTETFISLQQQIIRQIQL